MNDGSRLGERYRARWQGADSTPDVFAFIADQGQLEHAQIAAVLREDQLLRWKTREPLTVEDYLRRLPLLANDANVKLRLAVGEFEARHQEDTWPQIDEFTARFADLGESLVSALSGLVSAANPSTPACEETVVLTSSLLDSHFGRYRLVRPLGEGAFGRVYLAVDEELQRQVAIKMPRVERLTENTDAYLAEARIVANLDHPHIVPVYDVGQTEQGAIYVVSKLIDGWTLAEQMRTDRLDTDTSARWVAAVASALEHAHQRRLIHRDIKPSNILIDEATSEPYVADFGLAIREDKFLVSGELAGTPAYMSPEQARGEGHRLDGRSDLFSLGAVFYQMLTGRQAFRGSTPNELMQRVITAEPIAPRELDESVPVELERICLKALAKRASDRYATAAEMADDLLHWRSSSDSQHKDVPVIPKGLRSFDADDADFFLDLVPGPRNRNGLPECIQFWKQRIEQRDAEKTFHVGLIYGPSGCGKSSLVRAGLLPQLSSEVTPVYIEATAEETELRIAQGLRKRLGELPGQQGLVETFSHLRRQQSGKVVVIVDQFEQWLHAHPADKKTELVDALRQCDGGRLQAVVMVRDDFAMAAARFMDSLDIPIVQGHNFATVDLFDIDHAGKVLTQFGQAFGKLPRKTADLTAEETAFVHAVASGLAQDGQVVSVRLALFAEMIKGKPWLPETLEAVGGTQGIGVNFLEETFHSRTAKPDHRLHQDAAREVLKSLLPELGTDIKGHMRSHADLLDVSGYARRLGDFNVLLRILDGELRLITPTDPEGTRSTGGSNPQAKFYQLTHDYLVPSLREWLTRQQRETRRGRAELNLAERTALWSAKPENRHLPTFIEWARIQTLTESKTRTPPQRAMMRKAGFVYAVRSTSLLLVAAVLGWGAFEIYGHMRGSALVEALQTAKINGVPELAGHLQYYRRWTRDDLHALARHGQDPIVRLHASLALLPTDPSQFAYVKQRLFTAEPEQVATLVSMLSGHREELLPELWRIAEEPTSEETEYFLQAASALAAYDSQNQNRWSKIATQVADALVHENPLRAAHWIGLLSPAREHLVDPLSDIYRSDVETRQQTEIDLATDVLRDYAADDVERLADLLFDGQSKQFLTLYPVFAAHERDAIQLAMQEVARQDAVDEPEKERSARRQANAAIAALRLGRAEKFWPLLKHREDPRLRTWIMHRLQPCGAAPTKFAERLEAEADVSIRRALILMLGNYEPSSQGDPDTIASSLLAIYRSDPDPGIHSAAEMTLRKWGKTEEVLAANRDLIGERRAGQRAWYLTKAGDTMVVIPGPIEYQMGSPEAAQDRRVAETLHRRRIGSSFAIATKEVTVEQFHEFLRQNPTYMHSYEERTAPEPDCPQTFVGWYDAAAYCRWVSEKERVHEDQMCYPPIDQIVEGMQLPADYLSRTGYRLPTEAEWEFACRAGTVTSRYYGQTDMLLDRYAWIVSPHGRSWPVGQLVPNELGLFDMLGNVFEWCQERYVVYNASGGVSQDHEDTEPLSNSNRRVIRGASYFDHAAIVRSAKRSHLEPDARYPFVGLRIARTYTPPHAPE